MKPIAIVAAVVVGCAVLGGGLAYYLIGPSAVDDPATSELVPGSTAILHGDGASYIEIGEGTKSEGVSEGTKATVIEDSGGEGAFRGIRVRITEGPYTDRVVTVERRNLRPAD